MKAYSRNPWLVENIDEFNFLCCPECAYKSKDENSFQSHAVENHPKSSVFFSTRPRQDIKYELQRSKEKDSNQRGGEADEDGQDGDVSAAQGGGGGQGGEADAPQLPHLQPEA